MSITTITEAMRHLYQQGILPSITSGDAGTFLWEMDKLKEELKQLQEKLAAHNVSIGVGNGHGNLFVRGDYNSIKAVQDIIFENETLRKKVAAMESQEHWNYYQTLLKQNGFDGITDLLAKYHKLVEQVPAVAVPENSDEVQS